MEVWFANENREDTCTAPPSVYIDMDIGKDNDYKLSLPISDYNSEKIVAGGYFYMPDEEYGGMINDLSVSTSGGTVSFTGDTFRGMLSQRYVEPPQGQDYLVLNSEMHLAMAGLVYAHFGGLFRVSLDDTGKTIQCQIDRYCSVLEALEKITSSAGYRLEIRCVMSDQFYVLLSAVEIRNLSDDIEVSQDYDMDFEITHITRKYDYMLALGKGDLKDRIVRRLHLTSSGSVEVVQFFPQDAIVYKYDYPNAESVEQLLEESAKKFKEINQTDSQKIKVGDDLDLKLGDIVAGRDYVTGTYISEPVTRIIVKISNEVITTSYEIGVI